MGASRAGDTLRHAREKRRLSLDEIADRTKISPHILEAIDRDALGEVPGGLFRRGYLRAYTREVGLDSEIFIGDYLTQQTGSADEDVLHQLRNRFRANASRRGYVGELFLVLAVVVCLLLLLSRKPEPASTEGDYLRQAVPAEEDGSSES
jgi:cytoskeletal protein RodZ